MPAKECYHCRQLVADMKSHDCWTTTEAKLTEDLPEELLDAWARLRETASAFGDQRIYASHKSIMLSRKACYFFVRPRKEDLEVWFFLGRTLKSPFIRKTHPSSRLKMGHLARITHRDEVEAPLTDWLKEAYDVSDSLRASRGDRKASPREAKKEKTAKPLRKAKGTKK